MNAAHAPGALRNLGGLVASTEKGGRTTRGTSPGSSIGLAIEESKTLESTVVPPNEGNEVTRDERETSELDVVPTKWGNGPDGPHRGKDEPGSENRKGER